MEPKIYASYTGQLGSLALWEGSAVLIGQEIIPDFANIL